MNPTSSLVGVRPSSSTRVSLVSGIISLEAWTT